MKKLVIPFAICFLSFSCVQKTENKNVELLKEEPEYGVESPHHFIGDHKARVAILGVFHFSNPGLDSYKQKFSVDILSEDRQAEVNDLLASISKFQPTKILVEVPRKESDSLLHERYREYLNGELDISDKSNEIFQLGFRLAEKLGHDRIYASDAKGSQWFGAEIDWDNYDSEEYRKSLDQYEKTTRYDNQQMYELHDSLKW